MQDFYVLVLAIIFIGLLFNIIYKIWKHKGTILTTKLKRAIIMIKAEMILDIICAILAAICEFLIYIELIKEKEKQEQNKDVNYCASTLIEAKQLSKDILLPKYRNRVALGIDEIVIDDKRREIPYEQNEGSQAAPSPVSHDKIYQHQNIN